MTLHRIFWNWKDSLKNESLLPLSKKFTKRAIVFFASFLFIALFSTNIVLAASYVVNTTSDSESDGCSVGLCTLREAINDANSAHLSADTISFDSSVSGTITLSGNNLTIKSDLTITGPGARVLTISGNNASRVFVVRGFLLRPDPTVNISGLTITGGNASVITQDGITLRGGGGVLNTNGATLNLSEVSVRGNQTTTFGGGVATNAILLTVTRTNITQSSISNNTATLGGGGVSNLGTDIISSAVTTVTNSTITKNSALAEGGGVSNKLGNMTLISNTISNNQSLIAGGGILNAAVSPLGVVNMRNNIVARNSSVVGLNLISSDMLGIFNSQGNNLVGNNLNVAVSFTAAVDISGNPIPNANADIVGSVAVGFNIVDPLLGNLQNNGGQTTSRLLLPGSPALNKGNNCVTDSSCVSNNPPNSLTTDQRGSGFPRVVDTTIDIGAVEGSAKTPIMVTTLQDNESDGCGIGECTFREAIDTANSTVDFDTVVFDPALNGLIDLTNGQVVIDKNMTISGLGTRNSTIRGNGLERVLQIAAPITGEDIVVEITGVTITNGVASTDGADAGDGGGILNGAGVGTGKATLILDQVDVSNNTASSLGGGIATAKGAETIITNSLIGTNISQAIPIAIGASAGGGGISNAANSTTVIANSTISDNNSSGLAGGIMNAGGMLHLTNNTISHNQSATFGGGVVSLSGTGSPAGVTNLRNTIIAKNQAGLIGNLISSDVFGPNGSFNSLGNNLIGSNFEATVDFQASVFVGNTPMPNAKADLVGNVVVGNQIIDPLLGPLQDNGGPTNSRLPSTSSPAMNAGNNCVVTNTCATNPEARNPHQPLMYDQRGSTMPRRMNTNSEIGATEVPLAPTSTFVSASGKVVDDYGRGISRSIVRLTDSSGTVLTSVTNQFGYFELKGIPVGETCILTAHHNRYIFESQVLTLNDNVQGLSIFERNNGKIERK